MERILTKCIHKHVLDAFQIIYNHFEFEDSLITRKTKEE